jgi:SP family galactose:H+ symporter-like MFS transporter
VLIAIGLAIGVASYTAPLYIVEIAPHKLRGGLVTLNQLAITMGILLAYVVDAAFAPIGDWRFMFAFGAFPALALGLGINPSFAVSNRKRDSERFVVLNVRHLGREKYG